MSAALVRKSLQIVDPEYDNRKSKRKIKLEAFRQTPQNQKIVAKTFKKGKEIKINLLSTEKKLTVTEVRRNKKSKEQILKENLKKLELIRKASKVNLDETLVNKIINRAISRRPVSEDKHKDEGKTAFTEEDFKKFEEEYFDE